MSSMTFSFEEVRMLTSGKYAVHKCTSCFGNGWYWVHEDGVKRDPKDGEDLDAFYQHTCEFDENECGGLGFHIVFPD